MIKINSTLLLLSSLVLFSNCKTNKKNIVTLKQKDSLSMKKGDTTYIKSQKKEVVIKSEQTKVNPSDNCKCNATAYITKIPNEGIQLLNSENKIINKIFLKKKISDEFIQLKLKKSKNKMFQIESMDHSFEDNVYKKKDYYNLWIDGKHLEIFLPDAKVNVKLYKTPKEGAEVVAKVPAYGNYSIKIIKCCKNWIYGIYKEKNGNKYEGWFHPNDICSNPVTNC